MRLRSLLLLGTVLSLLFALALLLGPAIILKFFGLTGSVTEVLLAQLIGAGLIGVGVLSWFAKDFADAHALQRFSMRTRRTLMPPARTNLPRWLKRAPRWLNSSSSTWCAGRLDFTTT